MPGSKLEQSDRLSQGEILQEALTGMPIGVAWANPVSGEIEFINRKFTSMFGYTLADLGTVHEWIEQCYVNQEQGRVIDAFWRESLHAEGATKEELEDVELDIRCKDGSIKTVLSGKILLPQQSGALATFLDITPRKAKEEQIRRQAMEDALTGLLNRRAFSQYLEVALDAHAETGAKMALLLIDLDGFKAVNDTLGHDKGDQLLVKVAERLRHAVRERDILCRIGGDEFGVILHETQGEDTVLNVAERIIYAVARKPYALEGMAATIGASIGIALCPDDGQRETELFRQADRALYKAKNGGKGRWSR